MAFVGIARTKKRRHDVVNPQRRCAGCFGAVLVFNCQLQRVHAVVSGGEGERWIAEEVSLTVLSTSEYQIIEQIV